jgi:dienelactone hydrolase
MDLRVESQGLIRVASEDEWEQKRLVLADVLLDFLLPHPDELQPLDMSVLSVERLDGYERRLIEYSTLPGERVRAYLLVPGDAGALPAPGVLALHQTTCCGKDEVVGLGCDPTLAYGRDLVRRGHVVLAPDGITMGERVSGAPCGDTRAVYARHPHWSALGIMTWEGIQAVTLLADLPEVDGTRIGCIGHSHGGYGTLFLAAFDPRIRASVVSCGFMGLCHDDDPLRWARRSGFVFMPGLRPYIRKNDLPFDFHELLAMIAPRPLLNISASNDAIFPGSATSSELAVDEAEVVYEQIFDAGGRLTNRIHASGHSMPHAIKQEAYDWLDAWLGGGGPPAGPDEQGGWWVQPDRQEEGQVTVRVGSLDSSDSVFRFRLEAPSAVTLTIYDLTGKRVRRLVRGEYVTGQHEASWDGSTDGGERVATGIYFYRLTAGDDVCSGKAFVLR